MINKVAKKIQIKLRNSLGIAEIKDKMIQLESSLSITRDRMNQMESSINVMKDVIMQSYIQQEFRENTKYSDKKYLTSYEYQVYSQFGEDGIIAEIFTRIGTTNKLFVEIGASNGLENNTTNLLTNKWKGLWLEADLSLTQTAKKIFNNFLKQRKINIITAHVTTSNINSLLDNNHISHEFDFLSIDIDGNDYWIWKQLQNYHPRVVAIEYNASLGPSAEWIMKYNPDHIWNSDTYYGASLKSLELLGKTMGYKLVGCSLAGVNAFFVRKDLIKNKFASPFTSEHMYEAPKHFLYRKSGHPLSEKIFKDYKDK